ncbi:peptidase domain-containing ABC transporter [Bacillus sp. 165]|uniref:peptidase domain-containing ABC transporter n=1 Tax=Bacillus sp. 165 TaxID=1529117 RepID=UPI001AD9FA3F|nr:peptidase domain-containing ABC transporter [Bacillus sp. 165]MBO9131337.1 peptidase domain-containing ABC transporter [Bacillus sp. 165]
MKPTWGFFQKRFRVPFIEQMEQSECGLCCLAMVFSYYKNEIPLSDLRDRGGGGRDGTNLLILKNIAQSLGMETKGIKLSSDQLGSIPVPAILHWKNDHFVVLEKKNKSKIYIVDPDVGRMVVSEEDLQQDFSGTALLLNPGSSFTRCKGNSIWLQYIHFLFSEAGLVTSILIWSIFVQLIALVTPVVTQYLIDHVILPKNTSIMNGLLLGMVGLLIVHLLVTLLRARFLVTLQNRLDWSLMSRFFDRLLRLPYYFFQLRTSGDLILRANSNMIVREILSTRTVSIILDSSLLFIFLFYMISKSPLLTCYVVLIGIIQILILLFSSSRIKRLSQEELLRQTTASSYLAEVLHGILAVKAEGAERLTFNRWSQLFQEQINAARKRGYTEAYVDTAMQTLRFLAPLLLLWLGTNQVLSGKMTLGEMFSFNTLAISFLVPLTSIVSTVNQMIVMGTYFRRILDILDAPLEQDDQLVTESIKLQGDIELHNISFKYSPYSQNVIRNLSLHIYPGEIVAIVGPSGSGKSTLASLLLGLYLPTDGTIFFDGQDIHTLEKATLRQQIGVVMQNSVVFHRTVYQNIALHKTNLSTEQIIEAAQLAEIHNDIMKMQMKYETKLSESGSNISGGQRQRIALARALVHKPAILLLDEATSALDQITERRIYDNIQKLPCTQIIIAHRLSTIINADRIIVMDQGCIVEQGTHGELLSRNGYYSYFYQTKLREEQQN